MNKNMTEMPPAVRYSKVGGVSPTPQLQVGSKDGNSMRSTQVSFGQKVGGMSQMRSKETFKLPKLQPMNRAQTKKSKFGSPGKDSNPRISMETITVEALSKKLTDVDRRGSSRSKHKQAVKDSDSHSRTSKLNDSS